MKKIMVNDSQGISQIATRAVYLGAAAAAIFLAGCNVGPKYHQPAATVQAPPMSYKETPEQNPNTTGDWKIAQPQDAMLRGKWWEIYNDTELNTLEEQLNINNQNIKQYFENFMEARTLIAQARSQLYPTLSVAPSYSYAHPSGNLKNTIGTTGSAGGSSSGSSPKNSELATLPFSASWEPDLWGKVRNLIHEQQYNAQLSAADMENERLTEQASLAVFFFELHGQDAVQKVFDQTVATDKKALELTKARYETGIDDQISVAQAQNVLDSAQAASTNLSVARAQYEHAIAVLIGTAPSGFSLPVKPLDAAPPVIPVGVPSQLLERRPDIAASERAMAAANAQIGIATAAYYPTLTLSGSSGFESSLLSKLLTWPSHFWTVGPTISETIFDAGLRRATVKQYVALYNADLASYRQTVLTAFQQVEDDMAAVRILSKQIQEQQQAVKSAQQYLDLAQARYDTGVDTYLNVLVAQTLLLNDQQTLANLHTQVMTSSVQLIEALGGGWERSQLPSPAQVSEKVTVSKTD
ncbi:MAG TPA: efflux transporter outer membrane subunit [Candidatus Acidoferrum sp.]|nr:efflux transporter outer membrane subunit [Candidatus Acidoferrum sp.]